VIRQKLEVVLKKGMKDPAFQKIMDDYKVEITYISGKDFGAHWRAQYDEMGKVVNALGLAEK